MLTTVTSRLAGGASLLAIFASAAIAAPVGISTTDPANGITLIYSTSIQGPLQACTGSDPAWCAFFGGKPPPVSAVNVSPNPTGVANLVPGGIAGPPPSGSYLNLNLTGGNTSLDLTGGVIAFPSFTIVIASSPLTVINPSGTAGFVIDPTLQTAAVNGSGQAEFLVNLSPGLAADFSTFSTIVQPADCTGPLCSLVSVLSLDMVRYRLFIDYDPTFTTFTASFRGQTATNGILDATLNSVPVPGAVWLMGSALAGLGALRRRISRAS